MEEMKKYLLQTATQIGVFRLVHAEDLKQYAGKYRKWIRSLPLFEWVPLAINRTTAEVIIGIICILHIDGYIKVSFKIDNMVYVRREPMNADEYNNYINTNTNGPGKRTKRAGFETD